MNEYGLWIGGAERKGVSQRTVRVPFDGAEFARVEEAGLEQVAAAVEAAQGAAGAMREMTRAQRSAILRGTRERLLAAREEFAVTIASESGKPLREARTEVDRGGRDAAVFERRGEPVGRGRGPDGRRGERGGEDGTRGAGAGGGDCGDYAV